MHNSSSTLKVSSSCVSNRIQLWSSWCTSYVQANLSRRLYIPAR